MRITHGVPFISSNRVEQKATFKRLPAVDAASLLKTVLLAATLSLTIATAAPAQSYDPDLGSGNIARSGVRYGGWGRGVWSHRADFVITGQDTTGVTEQDDRPANSDSYLFSW